MALDDFFSLFGVPAELANPNDDAYQGWGLLPRTAHHLFARATRAGGLQRLLGRGGSLRCSFLEICDERVHDLLGGGGGHRKAPAVDSITAIL